ncbi:hypothetical protein [Plantactinospora sp. B5E13]
MSGTRTSPLAAAAGLTVDGYGRIVTDAALRSVSHREVYAIGDAAAIRQGYGVMRHLPGRYADRGARRAVDRPGTQGQAAQAVPLRLLPHAGEPGTR